MTHAAIHDALNAIDRRYRPYAFDVHADPNASPEAAVAAAAYDVLVHEVPAVQQPILEAAYADSLSGIPDGAAKDAGIAIGQGCGRGDHRLAKFGRLAGSNALHAGKRTRRVDPDAARLFPRGRSGVGKVTPFALRSGAQFRLKPPEYFDLTSEAYTADYEEVKSIGEVNSPTRTEDQSEIAKFWYEGSQQGWNRLSTEVLSPTRSRSRSLGNCAALCPVELRRG